MEKYLKPKQHYIDLYDWLTVDLCRQKEAFHNSYEPEEKNPILKAMGKTWSKVALVIQLEDITLNRHYGKERAIQEWIERDTKRGRLYDNAEAPDIKCLCCKSMVIPKDKILCDDYVGQDDKILFMYDCPNGCLPRRAFFDNGEEYRVKPNLCPDCRSGMTRSSERVGDRITTTESCSGCKYVSVDHFDLASKKEELPDLEYQKDRDRFCLSGEALEKAIKGKAHLERISKTVARWDEEEKNKEQIAALERIKKLTSVGLENLVCHCASKQVISSSNSVPQK